MSTKRIHISIASNLHDKVKEISQKEKKDVSHLFRTAMINYINYSIQEKDNSQIINLLIENIVKECVEHFEYQEINSLKESLKTPGESFVYKEDYYSYSYGHYYKIDKCNNLVYRFHYDFIDILDYLKQCYSFIPEIILINIKDILISKDIKEFLQVYWSPAKNINNINKKEVKK